MNNRKNQLSKANLLLSEAEAKKHKKEDEKKITEFNIYNDSIINKEILRDHILQKTNEKKDKKYNLNHMFKIMDYLEKDKNLESGRKELRVIFFCI